MARNKELNQKIKDERRDQILSNALELFAKKGLSATKITDISLAAGISQGLIYHYFRSKEEIFVELIRNAFEKMNAAALGLESLPISPQEKIRIATEKLLQGLEDKEDAGRYYLFLAQAAVSEAIPDEAKIIIRRENGLRYDVITRIIEEGQKEDSFKKHDAKELALVFWTSITGLAIYKAIHGDKFKAPDPNILISIFLP